MPRACLSLHSWFSPGFCASCTMFYLYSTLPTALLNTSHCFALSCSHYSARPSFPFVLPLHVVFLMFLPASKPVCPPFCPPGLLCLFLLQLLVLIHSLPPPNPTDYADPHPLHTWIKCLLTRCLDGVLLFCFGWCSARSIPQLCKCCSGQKGAHLAHYGHFEKTFLGLEGLWISVRLIKDEQDV